MKEPKELQIFLEGRTVATFIDVDVPTVFPRLMEFARERKTDGLLGYYKRSAITRNYLETVRWKKSEENLVEGMVNMGKGGSFLVRIERRPANNHRLLVASDGYRKIINKWVFLLVPLIFIPGLNIAVLAYFIFGWLGKWVHKKAVMAVAKAVKRNLG